MSTSGCIENVAGSGESPPPTAWRDSPDLNQHRLSLSRQLHQLRARLPKPLPRSPGTSSDNTDNMTTAHRPTFDPARGKEAQRGPAYHQRLLPAHTTLKHRQAGQGGDADGYQRDLRAELLEAEARHYAKKNGTYVEPEAATDSSSAPKRQIEDVAAEDGGEDEADAKRRRIEMLEQYREIDADDSSEESESSDEE